MHRSVGGKTRVCLDVDVCQNPEFEGEMSVKCPKCEYERKLEDLAPETECPRCGVIYAKAKPREARPPVLPAPVAPAAAVATPSSPEPSVAQPQAKTTSCPACAGLVAFGAKTCPHCGQANPAPFAKQKKPVGKLGIALAALLLVFFIASLSRQPSQSTNDSKPEDNPQVRQEAQLAIRVAGYACDSVDAMRRQLTRVGFRVNCNGFRYAYTITDEGGRMVVRLD